MKRSEKMKKTVSVLLCVLLVVSAMPFSAAAAPLAAGACGEGLHLSLSADGVLYDKMKTTRIKYPCGKKEKLIPRRMMSVYYP